MKVLGIRGNKDLLKNTMIYISFEWELEKNTIKEYFQWIKTIK